MENRPPENEPEKILGLDPRGLLARRGTSEMLRAWLPPEPEELAPLFPQLEILEIIGRGGMGAVYRGRQPELDRLVALKLLPAVAARDGAFAERFRNEARALARLQHPHIVAIYETGQTTAGHLFIIMEYVAGTDLAGLLVQGPLPASRALGIAGAVCSALEFAHAHGVVHRDIKPGNVLVATDGAVKVADFGVARLPADGGDSRLTGAGTALGTPDYMAPEQRLGGAVDGRADLYSLGVMLYEMLTGELPRGAWQPPSRKRDTSPHLDAVVAKALQADPAHRTQTAAEMRAGLDHDPRARRTRWLGIAAAALVFAGAGVWFSQKPPPHETGEPAPVIAPAAAIPAPPDSPAGKHTPLATLDLRKDGLFGAWQWLDGIAGGTLASPYEQEAAMRAVSLSINPGQGGYEVAGEVLLEHRGASLTFIFPAGTARLALMLEHYDTSGLELVDGANWMKNPTSVLRLLPYGRFMPLTLKVTPAGDRVSINVTLDGQPFIAWEGPQSALALPADYAIRHLISRTPAILLISENGGVQVRGVEIAIAP